MQAIALLQLRQILGGRRFVVVVGFLSLPVLLTILIRLGEGLPPKNEIPHELFSGIYLFMLYPQSVAIVLALLYGTSVLNNEISQQTVTYLFTRPIWKWQIVVAKYLVNVVVLSAATLVSLTLSWLILGVSDSSSVLAGVAVATVGATLAFNALFGLIGVIFTRKAMIVSLGYAALFEFVLSFIPAVINSMSVIYYLRSAALRISEVMLPYDLPDELLRIMGQAELSDALFYTGAVVGVSLILTATLAAQREFAGSDEA